MSPVAHGDRYYNLHFTSKETEAQKDEVADLQSVLCGHQNSELGSGAKAPGFPAALGVTATTQMFTAALVFPGSYASETLRGSFFIAYQYEKGRTKRKESLFSLHITHICSFCLLHWNVSFNSSTRSTRANTSSQKELF